MRERQEVGKIRILRVMARFNLGGPAQQISSLMTFLDKEHSEQKLVVGECADDEIDYSTVRALSFDIDKNPHLGRKIKLTSDFLALAFMIKTYYQFRPDIVHSHTAKAGLICRIARIFYIHKVRLVHTYHGHLLYGYFNPTKTRLLVLIEKFLGLFTSRLVTVGNRVRDELLAAGVGPANKFQVIPPGITFLESSDSEGFDASREEKAKLSIGFVGRVTQIKRPDKFLEVVEAAQVRRLDVSFHVAGDGNLLNEMKTSAEKGGLEIEFLGWVADIEPLFENLDILVLTSDNEGTPISIIQAAAHGCISLSTDVGSVEDVLIDGKTGFLCDKVDEFVEKLDYLGNNPAKLQEMQSSARSFAVSNFSGQRLARDHAHLYQSLISR